MIAYFVMISYSSVHTTHPPIYLHADPQAVGFGEVLQHELERVVHRAAAVFAVLVAQVRLWWVQRKEEGAGEGEEEDEKREK